MAEGQGSSWRQLPQFKEASARPGIAYSLRVGAMSKHWRVLEPSHGNFYVAGGYLHPALWFLRCTQRQTWADRCGRTTTCCGSSREAGIETCGCDQREPR